MALPRPKTPETSVQQIAKKIRLRPQNLDLAREIAQRARVSPVASRVLAARGFEDSQALKNFLEPTLKEGLPDPWLLKGLKEACAMIAECKKKNQSIAICCDFDVDGLSGGSLVYDFFQRAGIASKVFVPDRFVDGYGLNENTVELIAKSGFSLLLTIDYGTTNAKEIALARKLGIKTIVVDHHHVGSHKPGADIFINPQQPDCGFAGGTLCAAGLAWYLVVGLRTVLQSADIDPRSYLDIACLGTICDMVPLLGANRVIAKRGLEQLSITRRAGLRALKEAMGAKGVVGCSEVGFGIGPRLNAAGRIVHGETVIELLTTTDERVAREIAKNLNDLNSERQDIEQRVKQAAIQMVEEQGGAQWGIVVGAQGFHTGVIGIVAQRLVETYYRPAVVLGGDSDGIFKGSVRGIKGFSVVEALGDASKLLIKFGGHDGAGGLSIEEKNIPEFREVFQDICQRRLKKIEVEPYVDADAEAELKEINLEVVNELKGLAPFGMGNPAPQILVRGLRVATLQEIKSAHLKVLLSDGNRFISGMLWRQTAHPALKVNNRVSVAFRPEASTYQGNTELMANIQAVEIV